MSRRLRSAAPAALAVCSVLLAACAPEPTFGRTAAAVGSADADAADPTEPLDPAPDPAQDTLPRGERNDGVLRIGLLYPESPPGSAFGLPLGAAADYAIDQINEAGGWNDERVELIRVDEGSTADAARESIDELLAAGVDAVVGPASSTIALATLDRLLSAGVLTCSPTASALLLDDYPDRDLFFRTIPSDSLQMEAIASQAGSTGATTAAVVYLDDEFGRGLAGVVERALPEKGVELVASLPFHRGDDLETIVQELSAHRQTTIIVLADAAEGMRVLEAISDLAQLFEPDARIVVNDAVRPIDPEQWRNLDLSILEMVRRVSPVAAARLYQPPAAADGSDVPGQEVEPPAGNFVANVVDCINLITLSAIAAGSDDPVAIERQMREVTDRGLRCETFADCVGALRRQTAIAYAGASPDNELYYFDDDRGDVGRARVMVYRIDPDGFDRAETTILVGPVR